MKQRLIEYLENSPESKNYNKSATRYLYLREPELWKWVLESTLFLPINAKPKQRIWHIVNDNFNRPVCPVTGEFVKWWENRYLTYSSRSAKARSPDHIAKRTKTCELHEHVVHMLVVEEHTKNSWYYSYSRINPNGLERGIECHLDHIYSQKAGFDNNVPPEVVGHWTNLRLLPAKENNGKGARCDKTIEKLYEDYQSNKINN